MNWHSVTVSLRELAVYARAPEGYRMGVFHLRRTLCGKLSVGCREHRFCGLCEPCRASVED